VDRPLRVTTFKSSLATARHSLAWGRSVHHIAKSEIYDVTIMLNHGKFLYINDIIFFVRADIFSEQGLIGLKFGRVWTGQM